jgi:hypothetical protein
MAVSLLFPYIALNGSKQLLMQAPTTDSLPLVPDNRGQNLVLTQQVGVFAAGGYQWVNSRWQFVVSYAVICNDLFGVSQAFLVMPNVGDNLLPIGDSGAALVAVYRNGSLLSSSSYSVVNTGIVLTRPAALYEVYLVFQRSPLTPTTPVSGGGGGISDAPSDGHAYVRKNASWEIIQNELNEGNFTGI